MFFSTAPDGQFCFLWLCRYDEREKMIVEGIKQWNKLLKEGLQSPFTEVFQMQLDAVLGNLLLLTMVYKGCVVG